VIYRDPNTADKVSDTVEYIKIILLLLQKLHTLHTFAKHVYLLNLLLIGIKSYFLQMLV